MNKKLFLSSICLFGILLSGCGTNNPSENPSENTEKRGEEEEVINDQEEEHDQEEEEIPQEEQPKEIEINKQPMVLANDNIVIEFDLTGARIKSLKYDGIEIGEKGFVAGRVANRIAGASFELDGVRYNTTKNEGNNTLHGGNNGFGDIKWTLVNEDINSITFSLESRDGDNGFPGKLVATTKYTLNADNKIDIEYSATTNKKTLFNPTNHLYMNLNGTSTNLSNHQLLLNADKYTEVNSSLIPTGNLLDVANTKFDYRTLKTYNYSDNIDHNFVLNGSGYRKVAELIGTKTNIKLDLFTDQPGLQVYNTPAPREGNRICLETQHFPDAIHHEGEDGWDSIILSPEDQYYSKTTYQFSKTSV